MKNLSILLSLSLFVQLTYAAQATQSSQIEIVCIDDHKYIKITENNNTQLLPKLIYHTPTEVKTQVGWRTVHETVPGYQEHEECRY